MAARKRIDSRIISAAMAFFLGTLGTVGTAQSRTGSAPGFRVEIEQDGRPGPIRNHELTIQRKPFDIVLYFPKSGGQVALRSATQSALYDLAKSGKPLGTVFRPAQTIAEEEFDKAEDLILDDQTGQNVWSYDPADPGHRFSEVRPTPNGFKCRRRIANYFLNDKDSPVAGTDFLAIYLVFHNGQFARDLMSSSEGDREYLKISFSPPSKASIDAGATRDAS